MTADMKLPGAEPGLPRWTRRRFLQAAGTMSGGLACTGLYSWRWEPHWVETVERALPIAGLPRDLQGARLVQLSDLHIGPRVDDDFLQATFAQVQALRPDLVVYTGDFISYEPGILAHAQEMFRHLPQGRRGTFAVLGNHDYGLRWAHPELAQGVAERAQAAGVRVLRNEVAEAGGLHLVGLEDLWSGRFNLAAGLQALPRGAAAVVLSHNPDTADLRGWDRYSGWILAGHTHGGQCRPPFLPPPLLPVRNRRYTCGEFDLAGGRRLYINRGLGHLIQVRFQVRPEVTVFTLARA
jgi:predicted MPP superfamily phosphohydrolase